MKTHSPKISVIIPAYNRKAMLLQALVSVQAQTFTDFECLVIDDGSSENLEEVVLPFTVNDARFMFYRRPTSYGAGGNGARNFGLDLSCGEFVNWFDSDDVMLPNFLQDKIELICPQHQFVVTSHEIVDGNLNTLRKVNLHIEHNIFKDYVFWKENFCIGTPNILFRKSFLVFNGFRFNETIKRGQESELYCRIFYQAEQRDFATSSTIGFMYRQHADTKTNKSKNFDEEFTNNHLAICRLQLDFSMNRRDKALIKFLVKRLVYLLFISRGKSKDIYFEEFDKIDEILPKHTKRRIFFQSLKFYFAIPGELRLDSTMYRLIAKCI